MKQESHFCPNCGFKNAKGAKFCGHCGKGLGPKKALKDAGKIGLFGIIGSILILLIEFVSLGWAVAIVGFVFVGIAVYTLSKNFNYPPIFKNYALYLVTVAVGIAAAATYILIVLSSSQVSSLVTQITNATSISASLESSVIQTLLVPVVLTLAVLVATFVISAIFLRRSFNAIAERTGVHLFASTGMVYLVGAALTAVFGLGLIIIFVAFILQAIAFYYLWRQSQS